MLAIIRAAFAAARKALQFSLWALLLPFGLLAPRGETDIPHAPARQTPAAEPIEPAQAAKVDPVVGPDLELQAASAVNALYRRVMGWPYRDQLTGEKFSPPVLAWLGRLTGDEARAAVTAGKAALVAHFSGKKPIDGLSPLYGRKPSAVKSRAANGRGRPAPADDDESLDADPAYLAAARI